ncbi:inactive serine protease 39 [Ochotona princeps]|uniref:inactive serine protease 39 n=1 Tax=Ochotona princeps TaxID=9978 RepID=UPI002714E3F5|nr:inactive serine protease 39 [Ochotona princeps]
MGGSRRGRSGLGRQGACALAALLLWLCLPPLSAQTTPSNPSVQNQAASCGRSTVTGKIFGGQAAAAERWPWLASVVVRRKHICGASLISNSWVLSAGSCVQRSEITSDYRIWLGYTELGNPTNFSKQVKIDAFFTPDEYNKAHPLASDVSLLHLEDPVEFNSHVRPICLPENSTVVPMNSVCWIYGWGKLTQTDFLPSPFPLQEAKVSLTERDYCRNQYMPPIGMPADQMLSFREDNICAHDPSVEKSMCAGDAGGPLSCYLNGAWYAVGVTSWSGDCQSPVSPTVFASTTYHARWIKEKQNWVKPPPTPKPTKGPSKKTRPPAMTNKPIPDAGAVHKPRVFLVLLSSATLLLLILLQSQ